MVFVSTIFTVTKTETKHYPKQQHSSRKSVKDNQTNRQMHPVLMDSSHVAADALNQQQQQQQQGQPMHGQQLGDIPGTFERSDVGERRFRAQFRPPSGVGRAVQQQQIAAQESSSQQSHQHQQLQQQHPQWQMEYAPAHMEAGVPHPHGYHVLPSLYFSNFTANVNVHGYTQAMQPSYLHQNSQTYMPADSQQNSVEQVSERRRQRRW